MGGIVGTGHRRASSGTSISAIPMASVTARGAAVSSAARKGHGLTVRVGHGVEDARRGLLPAARQAVCLAQAEGIRAGRVLGSTQAGHLPGRVLRSTRGGHLPDRLPEVIRACSSRAGSAQGRLRRRPRARLRAVTRQVRSGEKMNGVDTRAGRSTGS